MNWAAYHLANRQRLGEVLQGGRFYTKEGGTQKSSEKNASSLQERNSAGDNGSSLAELWYFHCLGLLLGKRKIFLLPAVVGSGKEQLPV